MSVGRLIEFFSTFTKLPVYIEDICGQMVDMGIQDEIVLIPMDAPPQILLGMMVRYRESGAYTSPKNCALIFYNVNVGRDEQRLICCKELIHLFDTDHALTCTSEDFLTLVEGVIDLEQALSTGTIQTNAQAFVDHAATLMALAVLFPHEIRDDIIAAHDAGRMSIGDIADEFDIPADHIPMLLSKTWDAIRTILMKF